RRDGTGTVVDEHAVAERHERRDRGDLELGGELLVRVGVHLRERDVLVRVGDALEHGAELLARTAPLRPEVDEGDAVGGHRLLEVLKRESCGRHRGVPFKSRMRAGERSLRIRSPRPTWKTVRSFPGPWR